MVVLLPKTRYKWNLRKKVSRMASSELNSQATCRSAREKSPELVA